MKKKIVIALILFGCIFGYGQNLEPVVSIISSSIDETKKTIDITYNISDDDEVFDVEIILQNENEELVNIEELVFNGDVGASIQGTGLKEVKIDYTQIKLLYQSLSLRIIVDDKVEIGIDSIINQVNQNILEENLQAIVGVRHSNASPENLNQTREFIKEEFTISGLDVETQPFDFRGFKGENVIGFHKSISNSNEVMIIDAHFDSVSDSPGADDNGSGTVGLIEAARILSKYKFRKSLQFIGFDQEESGLIGSDFSVQEMPENYLVDGVINLEMIGYYSDEENSQTLPTGFGFLFPEANDEIFFNDYKGDFIGNIANSTSSELSEIFTNSAINYISDLKVIPIIFEDDQLPLVPDLARSDHAPYWAVGIPALFITDTGNFRNPNYHRPTDTIETIDFHFLSNVVKTVIAATANFAGICHCGIVDVSFVTSNIDDTQSENCDFKIYAGASSSIMIEALDCFDKIDSYMISDISGKLILSGDAQNSLNILEVDVPNVSPGIYIFQLNLVGGKVRNKKFYLFRSN